MDNINHTIAYLKTFSIGLDPEGRDMDVIAENIHPNREQYSGHPKYTDWQYIKRDKFDEVQAACRLLMDPQDFSDNDGIWELTLIDNKELTGYHFLLFTHPYNGLIEFNVIEAYLRYKQS